MRPTTAFDDNVFDLNALLPGPWHTPTQQITATQAGPGEFVPASPLMKEAATEAAYRGRVKKRSGYEYPGFIVSVFTNRAGAVRYVVEADHCLLRHVAHLQWRSA